ncbi:MAG: D-alanine--D-alanine ligase [bacterium]|nr:D-alanine--D-alanine ligase [bacterium]
MAQSRHNSLRKIAVVFGGRSVEHEISIITALEVMGALDPTRYKVVPVYIHLHGHWYTGDGLMNREFYTTPPLAISQLQEVTLLPVPGGGGLTVVRDPEKTSWFRRGRDEVIPVDVYLPVLHGTYGEDGCLQGLLEMAEVAYTGSPVLAAALGMDKYASKLVLKTEGIPVLPAITLQRNELAEGMGKLRERILSADGLEGFPLFVKPRHLGSSVGISAAANAAELDAAIIKAFQYDTGVIVEPQVSKIMEINISVMDVGGKPLASVVEVPASKSGVLTYEEKYVRERGKKGPRAVEGMAGLSRSVDPPELDSEIKAKVTDYACRAFRTLGCSGVARIDFILDLESGNVYLNELNTLPGSMAYYLWSGSRPPVQYTELLDKMIDGALERRGLLEGLKRDFGFRALK